MGVGVDSGSSSNEGSGPKGAAREGVPEVPRTLALKVELCLPIGLCPYREPVPILFFDPAPNDGREPGVARLVVVGLTTGVLRRGESYRGRDGRRPLADLTAVGLAARAPGPTD